MSGVLISPGSGPVESVTTFRHALRNAKAFVADLDLTRPAVKIEAKSKQREDGGRYMVTLRRGIRSVEVHMPGISLDEVRYLDGMTPWNFPRLYVDGSSWLWKFALNITRGELADHNGVIERRKKRSERQCKAELTKRPHCDVCETVLDSVVGDDEIHSIRCLGCNPVITERRETYDGAVYGDDGWRHKPHYFVKIQEMPPEVPGHGDPAHPYALCGAHLERGSCRLKRKHAGRCEPYRKVIERTYVDPTCRSYGQGPHRTCDHGMWEPGTPACPGCGTEPYAHFRARSGI